ncbi:hypothetical protein [Mycoplasma sp. 4044]
MNLFLDGCLEDLAIGLYNSKLKLIDKVIIDKLNKKVDVLPHLVEKILTQNSAKVTDLNAIYINVGPGSFTGSRIALTFARTICQIHKNTQLYVTSTIQLLKKQLKNDILFIKANKYTSYKIDTNNDEKHELVKNIVVDEIDYSELLINFKEYQKCFTLVEDLESVDVKYFHDPQIGGLE